MDVENKPLISLRRKTRIRKEAFDKKLLSLKKEEVRINRRIRQQEWIELKPPIQRGYVRYFVVRQDVRTSREAAFFTELLRKINTSQWSSREDFKKKRRRHGKKYYGEREQRLRDVSEREFLRDFTEKERSYFYEISIHENKRIVKAFRCADPWRFALHIQPNIIRKVQLRNPLFEKRKEEIAKFLHEGHRARLGWMKGVSWSYKSKRPSDQKLQNTLHYVDAELF